MFGRILHILMWLGNTVSVALFPLHFIYGGELYRYIVVPSVCCVICGLVMYILEHKKLPLIVSMTIFVVHVLCTHA